MSRYYPQQTRVWQEAAVRGGTLMQKSVVWEGSLGLRSAFFRMPAGMSIPTHTHPLWVQVMVLEGELEIAADGDATRRVAAGGCYFVEPGDTHRETALVDSLVLVTQGEDRAEFPGPGNGTADPNRAPAAGAEAVPGNGQAGR